MGLWRVLDEAFWVGEVSSIQNTLAMSEDGWRLTMMQRRRREEADAGVVVLFVVPAEEVDDEGTGVLDGTEAGREAWPILQGSELTFRVRVVVGDMRAAVGFGNTKIAEQESNRF